MFNKFASRLNLLLLIFLSLLLCSCASISSPTATAESLSEITQALTATSLATATETLSHPGATETVTPTSTEMPEPAGCRLPSTDYTIIQINGYKLNRRTYDMLVYAQSLYNGQIDILDAITQGSYTDTVEASFGTHRGGGAVDLSVMSPGTFTLLTDEIEPLIHALRLAGFAAWFRDFDVLYDGSPVHVHAIAIGDSELSLPAREQLAGPFGYFWRYDGLPQENGVPQRDPHGGPLICDWMLDMGYPAKTATPSP